MQLIIFNGGYIYFSYEKKSSLDFAESARQQRGINI